MSKSESVESSEVKVPREHREAHPSEAALVKTCFEALKYATDVQSAMLPSQLGIGRLKNTVLVQLTNGEWLRVTIKVTGNTLTDEG